MAKVIVTLFISADGVAEIDLAAGLLDELRLLVHPVAARKGRRRIYAPGPPPAAVGYDEVKDQVPAGT